MEGFNDSVTKICAEGEHREGVRGRERETERKRTVKKRRERV